MYGGEPNPPKVSVRARSRATRFSVMYDLNLSSFPLQDLVPHILISRVRGRIRAGLVVVSQSINRHLSRCVVSMIWSMIPLETMAFQTVCGTRVTLLHQHITRGKKGSPRKMPKPANINPSSSVRLCTDAPASLQACQPWKSFHACAP